MEPRSADDIEQSTEKLLEDLQVVVSDGEALLRAGAHDLGERGLEARRRLSDGLDAARAVRRKLQDQAIASARAADLSVRQHPYTSVGAAFGIGLVLGVLSRRR